MYIHVPDILAILLALPKPCDPKQNVPPCTLGSYLNCKDLNRRVESDFYPLIISLSLPYVRNDAMSAIKGKINRGTSGNSTIRDIYYNDISFFGFRYIIVEINIKLQPVHIQPSRSRDNTLGNSKDEF